MKLFKCLIILLFLCSCKHSGKQAQTTGSYNPDNALIVDSSCVIFITPDTTEIASMHAQNSEDDYQAWVNQVTWYPGLATTALRAKGIPTRNCHDKQYIVLKPSKQEEIIMTIKELSGDMILFNKDKRPFIVNSTDFEQNKVFILKYFDK